MSIFERLPQDEIALLNKYINTFGGTCDESSYISIEGMPHFLRFWAQNKADLYKMFGEQFILRKDISFNKNIEDLEEEMESTLAYGERIVNNFRSNYIAMLRNIESMDSDIRYELRRFTCDYRMLAENAYNGLTITIPGDLTVDGKPLQVNPGSKAVKMLGKICKAFGFTHTEKRCKECGCLFHAEYDECPYCHSKEYDVLDGYEEFRKAHSLVLNQKVIRGTLCLSIHPMDYVTMSDNDSGWESCMRWYDGGGDYRLGTIECMNSPYIVVAYLEARNPMDIYNFGQWNNKRWRQLIVITPELLLGNKQYPYANDDIQGAALKWMRELANPTGIYGPYDDLAVEIINHRTNTIGTRRISIVLDFDYMYNDIYDRRLGFIKSSYSGNDICYNLSGPAVCTNCGDVIGHSDDIDPSWTVCRECSGVWKCSICGELHHDNPYYTADSDAPLCSWCYHHETDICEVCGERVMSTEAVYIQVIPDELVTDENDHVNWNFVIDSCCYCTGGATFKSLFGPIFQREDMWGRMRNVVKLENMTDEGLERGDLREYTLDTLYAIRDAESDEDRMELVREKLL